MKKRHIITIAGRPGSGKSTTARQVSAELGYQFFSSGDLFRALGRERGHDVLQTNLSAEENAEVDRLVDQRLREMGASEDQIVIDSRMAWHWMPESFKVFLDLDLEIAAKRILKNMDPSRLESEDIPDSPTKYAKVLQARLDSENRRYKMLYDVTPYDMHHYDLVIDTGDKEIGEVASLVLEAYKSWHS
ncbi:MAG TPA: cytidylate kinase family protein [Candidatus Saccharimonadales bacterium]|nr:cytidylate kinase family protein [Candidatus Saccharimonadales bacterium]